MTSFSRRLAAALFPVALFVPAVASAEADAERMALGREVFLERAQPQCGLCHTLEDAGTTGAIGPILDTMRPDYDTVMRALTQGSGIMPPFGDTMTEEEMDAVAHYVSAVTAE